MRGTAPGLVLALTALAACAGSTSQGILGESTVAYSLDSINDRPLPYAPAYGTAPIRHEVISGMLLLQPDGRFVMDMTYFIANHDGPSRQSRVYDGTWSRSGNTFYFDFLNGGRNTAELRDGVLTMNGEGSRFVWSR